MKNFRNASKTSKTGNIGGIKECICGDTVGAITKFKSHSGNYTVGISHCRKCGTIMDIQISDYQSGFEIETKTGKELNDE